MNDTDLRLRIALVVIGGIIIAMMVALLVLMFSAGGGQSALVTDTTAAPTTATTTTTPTPSTTTTSSTSSTTTTTLAATTTTEAVTTTTEGPVDPSQFDTGAKTANATEDPGSALTAVRTGDHTTFARIVFDFQGSGTPAYEVGYEPGPTFTGSGGGDPVAPAGSAFLVVRISPGLTYDVDDLTPTYLGPTSFDPDLDPITEITFIDDFEADMIWVIGLDAPHGFDVSTRLDPPRVVIDISRE